MGVLLSYRWPGNVRELKSAVEFGIVRSKGQVIEASDLPGELLDNGPPHAAREAERGDERQRLLAALDVAKGNRVAAARLLGISRATLYRRLAELNIATK